MQSQAEQTIRNPLSHGHHLLQGSFIIFLAEILLPLTGIVTASFLTRKLGPGDYGLLTLASTLISWIELGIRSLFSRATVKVIGESANWRPVGAAILRLHVYVGMGALVLCWILSKPVALLLRDPRLTACFILLAVEIPIFSLAHCHRSLLIGIGRYNQRAIVSAARWIARLVFIILLVQLGLSLYGALLASICASAAELAVARIYIRPSWAGQKPASVSLWEYAVPIFFASLALRFLNLGLFLLKMLGGSNAQAGIYAAAQNMSFVMPHVLAISLAPLLLSTLTRVLRENDWPAAAVLGRNSIRVVLCMLPLGAIAAAASGDIAILLFGAHFAGAGPLMAVMIFAGLSMMMINLLNAILIACGKPSWALWLAVPVLPAALVGHVVAIPRFGAMGAAGVTTGVTLLAAIAHFAAARTCLKFSLPTATLIRSLLLSAVLYLLVGLWPTPGLWVIGKVAAAVLLSFGGFMLSGELHGAEIVFLRSAARELLSAKFSARIS